MACCGGMVTYGGAERMTFAVLQALREGGASVHCILNDWAYRDIAAVADELGATWSTSSYREILDRRTRSPRRLARLAWDLWRSHWDLFREAVRRRPTHVLVPSHDVVMRHWLTLILLRVLGVTVVMKMSNAPDANLWHRRFWKRWVGPAVSVFVSNSAFTERELLACGIPPAKVTRIFERLPRRSALPAPASRVSGRLVYVGQVIPAKGLHLLLDAVSLLRRDRREVSLDVVGDVDGWEPESVRGYRARVKARASEPDLAGSVRFLGWREDVLDVMARATLHCCPSLPETRESFGLVVLEAKSVGVPSVVFGSGALPELVRHGIDGWVCEVASPEALAHGCRALLDDAQRLQAAGEAARRSAERFEPARFDRAWLALICGTDAGPAAVVARRTDAA